MSRSHPPLLAVAADSPEGTVFATYQGGAYIDLHFDLPDAPAFDCINVWDYKADRPTIPCTIGAVRSKLASWLDTITPGELREYRASVGYRYSQGFDDDD